MKLCGRDSLQPGCANSALHSLKAGIPISPLPLQHPYSQVSVRIQDVERDLLTPCRPTLRHNGIRLLPAPAAAADPSCLLPTHHQPIPPTPAATADPFCLLTTTPTHPPTNPQATQLHTTGQPTLPTHPQPRSCTLPPLPLLLLLVATRALSRHLPRLVAGSRVPPPAAWAQTAWPT